MMTLPAAQAVDGLIGPICKPPDGAFQSKAQRVRPVLDLKGPFALSLPPVAKACFVQSAAATEPGPATAVGPAIPESPPVSEAREVAYDLDVIYANGQIWNPTTQAFDAVKLRSYESEAGALPTFVASAVEIWPGQTGQTVRITRHNKLPADMTCGVMGGGGADTPNCFNGSNLHSHGLWVDPAGNGDNVLLSINPGVGFQYEYNIPPDHPAGAFWYHSHRHSSIALQVSSGMAGALIVRGSRLPTAEAHGDFDTLLKPIKGQPFPERRMVFQQIQYDSRDANGNIETNKDGTYKCDPGQVGGVEDHDQFRPGTWVASGCFTRFNRAVLGHLDDAVAARIERWRMIHGGVYDTIAFQLHKRAHGSAEPKNLKAADAEAYVKANCVGDLLPLHLVAADELTLAAVNTVDKAIFQLSYRWDALVAFPKAGDYSVINNLAGASASVSHNFRGVQILGFVRVGPGEAVSGDPSAYPAKELETEANMPPLVREKIVNDLKNGMKLTSFTPHPDIEDKELSGRQSLTFNINVSQPNETFFRIDGCPYDANRIDRTLMLGGADEWTLKSDFVSHPSHIHVNPFQIVKIIAPTGRRR